MKEAIKSGDASVLQRLPDAIDMLVGQTGGCLGEVSALALLIGLAYMLARRIVTYAREDEDCYIDEHMGFIKFGSRVDLFLPVGTKVNVKLWQKTVGNETIIAKL